MTDKKRRISINRESLLSHRIRGFDTREATFDALKKALARKVRHIEFDVRLTKDRRYLVHHDPYFKDCNGTFSYIRDLTGKEIAARKAFGEITFLDDMLEYFSKNEQGSTTIHIDVKDFGAEQYLVDLVRKHDLLNRSVIVSWLPSVLIEVNRIEPHCRLCYSHITFTRFQMAFPIARIFLRQSIVNFFGKIFRPFWLDMGRMLESLRIYYDVGACITGLCPEDRVGYNHGHVVSNIVGDAMIAMLERTNGMVCIPKVCATRSLVKQYQQKNIAVAVFSIKTRRELENTIAGICPNILYIDNANLFSDCEPIKSPAATNLSGHT